MIQVTIKDKNIKRVPFRDIKIGDCFDDYGDIFVKISHSSLENNSFNFNAYGMQTFKQDATVVPVCSELVISYDI